MSEVLRHLLSPVGENSLCFFAKPGETEPFWVAEFVDSGSTGDFAGDGLSAPAYFEGAQGSVPWICFERTHHFPKGVVLDVLKGLAPARFPKEFRADSTQKRLFFDAVQDLKETFARTPLRKAVPYAFAYSDGPTLTRENQLAILAACLRQQKETGGFVYGFLRRDSGQLGLSPELLFEKTGRRLNTVALAGTKGTQKSDEDFLRDPKELAEHNLVIQGLAGSLGQFSDLKIGPTKTKASAGLVHLETEVTLQFSQEVPKLDQLIRLIHPTPAFRRIPQRRGPEVVAGF